MTQSKPQAPSRRHHFIPKFLLREWRGDDDLLACYRPRDDGKLQYKRLSPKSVAYEDWLYETAGFPPEHAQQMEDRYFKMVDDRAAKAHRLLCDGRVSDLTREMTCDWARFIMSIWFRTPTDVKGLQTVIDALLEPEVSRRVLGMTVPEDFPAAGLNQLRMEVIRRAIDDRERGEAFLAMQWATITALEPATFMISDWPLDSGQGLPFLGHPQSYITLPISPSKLFVAAPSMSFLRAIGELAPGELERRQNHATVAQARRFVVAPDDRHEPTIAANFGREGRPSIARAIADAWSVPM